MHIEIILKKELERENFNMKVLLLDQIAKVNYKYTYPLANGLKHAGVDVDLAIDQKKEPENCLCNIINMFNTDEKDIGKLAKLKNYISSYKKISKMLKNGNYDIIHTEWFTFSPIDYLFLSSFKRKYNVKYVATVHDILPFNEKCYDMHYHRKLYALADSVILQAPNNIERFASLFPESKQKTHMIPHGHMLDYVEMADKIESREKLKIPQNKTVFLFFGQIKKVKGVDILLESIAQLKDKYSELYLVVAGNVWKSDFTSCENIIKKYNLDSVLKLDIRYIPDEEVKYYYSAADVCVLPYTDVYQSGVIQLAYGYKKPVISSDLPAFTQFVKEGETGYISKAGDCHTLAQAIEKALIQKDNLQRLGENGYSLVRNELDWSDLAKRILNECYM